MEIEKPPKESEEETSNAEKPQLEGSQPKTGLWGFLSNTGAKVLGVMDYIGEAVVCALGLDEPKFQYVMDGMDKEDWERAVAIDRERRLEDAILDAAEELQASEEKMKTDGDIEGGGKSEERKIKEYMDLVRDRVTHDFWEKEIKENPSAEREVRQVVPDEISPIARSEDVQLKEENTESLGGAY